MKNLPHKVIVVHEGKSYIVELLFTEQSVENKPPFFVSVLSAMPCNFFGDAINKT